jgi:hypothetical protein
MRNKLFLGSQDIQGSVQNGHKLPLSIRHNEHQWEHMVLSIVHQVSKTQASETRSVSFRKNCVGWCTCLCLLIWWLNTSITFPFHLEQFEFLIMLKGFNLYPYPHDLISCYFPSAHWAPNLLAFVLVSWFQLISALGSLYLLFPLYTDLPPHKVSCGWLLFITCA